MNPAFTIVAYALFGVGAGLPSQSMWIEGVCVTNGNACVVVHPDSCETRSVACARDMPCHYRYDSCRASRTMKQAECSIDVEWSRFLVAISLAAYSALPMYSTHAVSETCKFVFNSCQSH
ncbi:hypothetical protein ACCO45_001737 [Purpureocillium lilacinum]|uniref:Uncharacterized protein n=1 Tax=Purpureocillium lilacinum TaxID=33203 RepID=A0ACC4EB01_PURLI